MSSVKKNLTYNIVYQILIIIIPFITTPYISRVIGKEGVGIYSYTYSIAHYFVIFAMLGLNNYGNRIVAKYKDNKEKLSKEFSSLYIFQAIISIIMIVVYLIYACFSSEEYRFFSLLQTIYVVSSLFNISWLFFGLENFKFTVVRNVIIKVLSTLSIFIFVKKADDLYLYILILVLSNLFTQLALWTRVRKYVKFVKPTLKDVTKHLKPNLLLFIPVIAVNLYKYMAKIMLGNMSDMAQVGLYESAEKIINVPLTLIAALGTVMLPRTTNLLSNNQDKQATKYLEQGILFIIFISLPIIFGLFAVSDTLVPIYFGKGFEETSILIKILSISIIFTGIANVIRTQYLIPKERDKEYILSVFVGFIINLIVNCLLIPKYNAIGAIIGTVCTEIAVCIIQVIFFKEKVIFSKNAKTIIYFILSSIIMYIVVNVIGKCIENDLVNIIVKVAVGMIIYFGINFKYIFSMLGGRKKNELKNANI